MTLECFACKRNGFPNIQIDYKKETKEIFEPDTTTPHVHKAKVGAASATTTNYQAGTTYRGKDSSARDESIKKMQEQKQAHENKMLEGQMAIAEKNLEGMKALAESYKYLTDAQNGNTIELVKVVDRLTEILQKLSLSTASKKG